jgi:hypothetical protein
VPCTWSREPGENQKPGFWHPDALVFVEVRKAGLLDAAQPRWCEAPSPVPCTWSAKPGEDQKPGFLHPKAWVFVDVRKAELLDAAWFC